VCVCAMAETVLVVTEGQDEEREEHRGKEDKKLGVMKLICKRSPIINACSRAAGRQKPWDRVP
jgi:hypothetical protein